MNVSSESISTASTVVSNSEDGSLLDNLFRYGAAATAVDALAHEHAEEIQMIDEIQDDLRRDIEFEVILDDLLPLIPDEPIPVQDFLEAFPIIDLDLVAEDKATVNNDAVRNPTSLRVEDLQLWIEFGPSANESKDSGSEYSDPPIPTVEQLDTLAEGFGEASPKVSN